MRSGHERQVDERERAVDQRERAADDRDRVADERDRVADERDRVADERDRVADNREIAAEMATAEWSRRRLTAERYSGLADTGARLRQRLASLANEVATVQEQHAAALDQRARWDVRRASELHGRAVAARRFAQSEREIALGYATV